MTPQDLRQNLLRFLSLGDLISRFIPGGFDDRVLEYLTEAATSASDKLLQMVIDDFFGGVGPFGSPEEQAKAFGASSDDIAFGSEHGFDPTTIAIIIQLIKTFGPVILEWIRKRREQ